MDGKQREIQAFLDHMNHTIYGNGGLLDAIEDGDYEARFDIVISMNGKTLALDTNADLFSGLATLLKEEFNALGR